ncbi:MAG: helix-turn-helix domain-containing protein [Planctomycetota bacterium]
MTEFIDFDNVLKELNISETDLTKLISEGEIIAFKDDISQKLRFLKTDVTKLKESLKGKIYLTLEEVEKMAKMDKNEIMNLVSEGKLQAFKDIKTPGVIKFRKGDVLKMLRKNGGDITAVGVEEKKQIEQKVVQELPAVEPKEVVREQVSKKIAQPEAEEKPKPPKVQAEKSYKKDIKSPAQQEATTKQEEEELFLEPKEADISTPMKAEELSPPSEETFELNIEPEQKEEETLFKEEATSTEETDIELGTLLEESETKVKEKEEEEEEEGVGVIPKKPIPKISVPVVEEGYEENTVDMILLLLVVGLMFVTGFFIYDSFHILEPGKIVPPSEFTKQIGQGVASTLGAKDVNLDEALEKTFKIGGKKK